MFGVEAVDHVGSSWVRIAIMGSQALQFLQKLCAAGRNSPVFGCNEVRRANFALQLSMKLYGRF
jgi:glycine cleavage system aminomethyltransferase T